jgi:hypothetical protein
LIGFRHADSRFPFLWETAAQPAARWHGTGEGPCQYFADSPDGAWAEFLRHEEITDPIDLAGIERSLWAVEVGDAVLEQAHPVAANTKTASPVDTDDLCCDEGTYAACQAYARSARSAGATELIAPSAALLPGAARGQYTDGILCEAADRDGQVWVLYGKRPNLRAWRAVERGSPPRRVLDLVRHFGA